MIETTKICSCHVGPETPVGICNQCQGIKAIKLSPLNSIKQKIEEAKAQYDNTRYRCDLPDWLLYSCHRVIQERIEYLEELEFEFSAMEPK